MKRILPVVLVLLILSGLALIWTPSRAMLLSAGITRDTRAWQVAHDQGCFNCHGHWGQGGVVNPGAGKIPAFDAFAYTMAVNSNKDLEEWILDGARQKDRERPGFEASKAKRAVHMPAYRDYIDEEELALLKHYYQVVTRIIRPVDELAEKGYQAAKKHGCFSCHGTGGRFDMPNPGSLVGRIPAWQGEDFAELARDEAEIREWILDGKSSRLGRNPVAAYFLQRQRLKMPAYRDHIEEAELNAIVAYIQWLRDSHAAGHEVDFSNPAGGNGFDDFDDY